VFGKHDDNCGGDDDDSDGDGGFGEVGEEAGRTNRC
jgi:hypothetical protein